MNGFRDTLAVHVVLSVSVERGYPDDRMSLAREAVSFTTHAGRDEALDRYISELDADTKGGASLSLRRTFCVQASVPAEMAGSGCPNRWISDRTTRLLHLCGARPGAWARAAHNQSLRQLLAEDFAKSASELELAVGDGASDAFGGTAALALRLAGASRRSAAHAFLDEGLSEKLEAAIRRVGAAAWVGEETMPYLQDLRSALAAVYAEPSASLRTAAPQTGTTAAC